MPYLVLFHAFLQVAEIVLLRIYIGELLQWPFIRPLSPT